MKKTLILATVCGLIASVAPPAFASDSLAGTYIEAKEALALTQQTVKERPFIAFATKSTGSSTFLGTKGDYLLTTYDSVLAEPGIVTVNNDMKAGGSSLFKSSTDPAWKTTAMTSASGLATSTEGGGS